jgi:hypothetical protein
VSFTFIYKLTAENTFRDQVEMSDWALLKKMKTEQGVA